MPKKVYRGYRKKKPYGLPRKKRYNPNRKLPLVMNYADRPENKSLTKFLKPIPFPTIKRVKLNYHVTQNLNSTSLSTTFGTEADYYLNSLYAPEVTGGHQPYGFDQLVSNNGPYYRYKVNAAKVKLTFTAPGGGDDSAALNSILAGCIVINPTASYTLTGTGYDVLAEQNMSQIVKIPSSGSQHGTISFYLPMHKAMNWSKKDFNRDLSTTTAPYNGNPQNVVMLKIATANMRGSSAVTTVYCHIDITYYCELYSRVILAQS